MNAAEARFEPACPRVTVYGQAHAWRVPLDVRVLQGHLVRMLDQLCTTAPDCAAVAAGCESTLSVCAQTSGACATGLGVFAVPQEVTLTLVRDAHIWALNSEHLGLSGAIGPTNVLSFPALAPPVVLSSQSRAMLAQEGGVTAMGAALVPPAGDIVLSVDTLCRESFLYGQDVTRYALELIAHGVAHLAGHEHGSDMDACVERLLVGIGASS